MEQASQASSPQSLAEVILSADCVKTEVTKPQRYLQNAARNYLRSGTEPLGRQARQRSAEHAHPLEETSGFAVGIGYSEGNPCRWKLTFHTLFQEQKTVGTEAWTETAVLPPPPTT